MKATLACIMAGWALCVLAADNSSPKTVRPNLKGIVKDAQGKPLRDTMVFIYTAAPREGVGTLCPSCYADCRKRVKTDSRGRFTIKSLDPTLLFRVLVVGKGHRPEFVSKVDPAAKPIEVALKAVMEGGGPDQRVHGRVVDPEGNPVEGAVINIRGVTRGRSTRFGGNPDIDPMAVTDESGVFVIRGQTNFTAVGVDIEARTFAKGIFQRLSTGDKEHVLKLTEGVSIKGKVLKNGKPLSGVEVGLAGAERSSEIFAGYFSVATDKEGNFLFVNLPARTEYYIYGIIKSLSGKGAIPARLVRAEGDGTTLDVGDLLVGPGVVVEGQIKLTDAEPIPEKTRIRLGRQHAWDSTEVDVDSKGRFRFTDIPTESVSLSARISGYRLSVRNASLDPLNTSSLIGRITTNITNLIVEFEKGPRLNRVDGNQIAVREEPLRGVEAPPNIEDGIKVTGVVTDAETGNPLPSFTVTEGRDDRNNRGITWFAARKTTHTNGTFSVSLTKQRNAPAVLIEAEGWLPSSSGPFLGDTNIAVSLKKGSGPNGTVLAPDDQPVQGAKVYLTDVRNGVYAGGGVNLEVRETHYRGGTAVMETDGKGRFSFAPKVDAYSIIVISDAGYAEVKVDDLARAPEVRLQQWTRIEGKLLIGAKPGANESIRLWSAHLPYQRDSRPFDALSLHLEVTTSSEGEFVFGRVPPLAVEVYHSPRVRDELTGTTPMSQTTKLSLAPGETRQLILGGKGRPVTGRLVVKGYEGEIDWRADVQTLETIPREPEELPNLQETSKEFANAFRAAETDEEKKALQAMHEKQRKEATERLKNFYASDEGWAFHSAKKRYALNFAQDGTFRVEDVPSGNYTLKIDLRERSSGPSRFSAPEIARLTKEIKVPEFPGERTDEAFDLGAIELQARAVMSAGKPAPDFTVKTLDDKTIKLSDFRGKHVLLDFWAVWCGPCVKETPHLKETYEAFKDNPKFAMIGLSLDPNASAPRAYAKKNDLGWIQAFLGEWAKTDLPAQFGVQGIPGIILIGPDGKVVASGLRGDQIRSTVASALSTPPARAARSNVSK